MRRNISLGLLVVLIVTMLLPVSATETDIISPRYTHVNVVQASLTINELLGVATCYGRLDAYNLFPVEVVVSLQQYNNGKWSTIKTWSQTGTLSVICERQYAVASGYEYRVSVTGYVYNSNGITIDSASAKHEVNYP